MLIELLYSACVFMVAMSADYTTVLRRAFLDSIDVLGAKASHALIEDLRRYRVFLYDQNLSLEDLARGLREMVGEETTQLMLERVYLKLDELHSSHNLA